MRGREGLGCGGRRRPGHSASVSPPFYTSLCSPDTTVHTLHVAASFQGACGIFKCLACCLQPSVLLEASSPSRRALLVARGEKCSGSMVPTSLHYPFPHTCLPPPPSPPFLQASRCWVSASHLAMSTEVGPTSWRLLRHPHPQGHRSLLQSLPRSAHVGYDTHNGLSEGVGASCSVPQPNTKPLQIICLLFDSAWLGIEPSPMHARHTLYL